MSYTTDFIDGQQSYRNHEQCPQEASEGFLAGYSLEIWRAEQQTHRNLEQEK